MVVKWTQMGGEWLLTPVVETESGTINPLPRVCSSAGGNSTLEIGRNRVFGIQNGAVSRRHLLLNIDGTITNKSSKGADCGIKRAAANTSASTTPGWEPFPRGETTDVHHGDCIGIFSATSGADSTLRYGIVYLLTRHEKEDVDSQSGGSALPMKPALSPALASPPAHTFRSVSQPATADNRLRVSSSFKHHRHRGAPDNPNKALIEVFEKLANVTEKAELVNAAGKADAYRRAAEAFSQVPYQLTTTNCGRVGQVDHIRSMQCFCQLHRSLSLSVSLPLAPSHPLSPNMHIPLRILLYQLACFFPVRMLGFPLGL
jgi:hypothetical protein